MLFFVSFFLMNNCCVKSDGNCNYIRIIKVGLKFSSFFTTNKKKAKLMCHLKHLLRSLKEVFSIVAVS